MGEATKCTSGMLKMVQNVIVKIGQKSAAKINIDENESFFTFKYFRQVVYAFQHFLIGCRRLSSSSCRQKSFSTFSTSLRGQS